MIDLQNLSLQGECIDAFNITFTSHQDEMAIIREISAKISECLKINKSTIKNGYYVFYGIVADLNKTNVGDI